MKRNSEKRKNSNGVTISKLNIIFFCFAFLLSSFSMFVLGIFVGRGQAPITFKINDIKAEIAAVDTSKKKIEEDIAIVNEADEKKKNEDKVPVPKVQKEIKKEPEKKVDKPKPAPKKEELTADSFSIQVGAFRFENDADALVNKLKGEKLPAFKYVSKNTSDIWYRVRVGSFKTREDAKGLLIKLKDMKYDAFLVK